MEAPLSQDTRTGVLHLEDCIAGCRANASCLSVNYETGLCVMFDSSAELKPGKKGEKCKKERRFLFLINLNETPPTPPSI